MKFIAVLLCLGISGLAAYAAPQAPTQPMPARFQGDWNIKMEDCGTGDNDSALSIDAHWIRYYESGGPIRAVIVRGNSVALIAELTSAVDEKETWDAPIKLELSANGAVLTDKTSSADDHPMVRYKCPSHQPYTSKTPRSYPRRERGI